MDSQPLVTIILPAYNAAPYIKEAVDSILSQSYTNFELLIIDDCSTDDTNKIAQAYTIDKRVKVISNPQNLGLISTLNYGLSIAATKYIVRMDADDISTPSRIADQVAFMEENTNIGICGSWFQMFGTKNSIGKYEKGDDEIKLQMLFHCRLCHPSVIIRKKVLDDNNLVFSSEFPHAEDYELWARMAFVTKFANLQKILLKYRVHNDSITFTHADIQRQNSDRVIKYLFNRIGIDITHQQINLWIKVNYSHFDLTIPDITTIENLLISLINRNKQVKYVNQTAMEKRMVNMWFHICYNNIENKQVQKLFINSDLLKMVPTKNRLKFIVKSFIA